MNVVGLGAVMYTDVFIRVVVIWELGRTRDICTLETIVLTKWRCYSWLQHMDLNHTMFFSIIMHTCIHS